VSNLLVLRELSSHYRGEEGKRHKSIRFYKARILEYELSLNFRLRTVIFPIFAIYTLASYVAIGVEMEGRGTHVRLGGVNRRSLPTIGLYNFNP
jgi:hypothetical protein